MTIVEDILTELWNTELNYKGMRVNIFGIPRFKKYTKRSVEMTINRLVRNDIIKKELTGLVLSKNGKLYVEKKLDSLKHFSPVKNVSSKKDLLVMFDVPTEKKAEREWFRRHLKKFGYEMIQQSVWVGPSPLPKDFLGYLKEIKLQDCIKTFKLCTGPLSLHTNLVFSIVC